MEGQRKREGVGEVKEFLFHYKGSGYCSPPPKPENLPIPKESFLKDGWVTHARIDENPGIRGHDLCFDKTCQGNRLAKRAEEGQ